MINFIKSHKKLSVKLAAILLLVIILVLFIVLKVNKDICEWWTTHFVKGYLNVFGHITKYIPFSITEFVMVGVIVLTIIFLVFCLIYLIRKNYHRSLHFFLNSALVILTVFTLYQVTAEMAYNRHKVDVPLYENYVEKEEFRAVIEYFIDDVNECCANLEFKENGDLVEPISHQDLNKLLEEEYNNYPSEYLLNFTTNSKQMISSFIYREFHITGVTFMPTAEANVNTMNVASGKPFTYAHELAHTKGAMREEDADLIAAYITLHSSSYYLRYSGYYYTIGSLLSLADYTGNENDYSELVSMLDINFLKNLKFNRDYWNEHNSWAKFANWWNDIYLRISGEQDGSDSYGDDTPTVDPGSKEIKSFSSYQKLYFSLYY